MFTFGYDALDMASTPNVFENSGNAFEKMLSNNLSVGRKVSW